MAVEVVTDGTQTAVIGTEHTLATVTTPGTYVLVVDTRNQVNGDISEMRVYAKTLAADAQAYLVEVGQYAHRQGDSAAPGSKAGGSIAKLSNPVPIAHQGVFTLCQTAGAGGRAFPFSLLKVA